MATWLPPARQSFVDLAGKPLAGGFVYHYVPQTTVPKTTWLDEDQTTANTNPIQLDPGGQADIYGVGRYRQLVTDANNNTIYDLPTSGTLGVEGYVDARDYGLRQTSDDSVAIQAAINYAASIGGATVYLGPGPLTIPSTSQVIWPSTANAVSLKGDGPQATLITITGALTQDLFVLTAGNLAHCQIRDLGFTSLSTGTSGALIHLANTYGAHIENVRMAGGFFNGVFIEGGSNQYLVQLRDIIAPAAGTANACVLIGSDTPVVGIAQGIYIDSCKFAASQFGVYVRNASGISVADSECLDHGQSGFITSPATGNLAKSITLSNFFTDTCGLASINLGHSGGTVEAVSITGGSANNSQAGILIGPNPNVNTVSIVGVQVFVNRQNGIHNVGANAVAVQDCMIVGNGTETANTYDAILHETGDSCDYSHNWIGEASGFPSEHRYALNYGGTSDYGVVNLNRSGSSGTAPFNNTASGTHNYTTNAFIGT